MTKYVTVVYAIEDEKSFEPIRADIKQRADIYNDNQRPPVGICAVSASHEIQRVELLEEALNNPDRKAALENAQAILSSDDFSKVTRPEILLA